MSADINILVDCGTAYGHDPEPGFNQFPVSPGKIDFLFLTHAHIDHIGRVPDLIAAGFKGEIICTHGTKALLIPMLRDALSFSDRSDREIRNLEKRIDDLSWGFELNEVFSLGRGIRFKLGSRAYSGLLFYSVLVSRSVFQGLQGDFFRRSRLYGHADSTGPGFAGRL